jgi:D-threo-aldose 1-dehydrogenase
MLSTKVGRVADPFHPPESRGIFAGGLPHTLKTDYSYDAAFRSIEQSLLRLGRDRIEIVLVHDLDHWTHGDQLETHFQTAADGCVKALRELKEEKVIDAFGVGVNESPAALRFCEEFDPDVVLLAGRYSLLEQPALTDLLPYATEQNIGVILGGVYNSGILATGSVPGARYNYGEPSEEVLARVRAIEEVCASFEIPLRQAALQFVFGHPSVAAVVLGAVSPSEIVQNCADIDRAIPDGLWDELRSQELISPKAPTPQL